MKVFKNGPGKICGRQSLKNFTWSILEYFDPYNPSKIFSKKSIIFFILIPNLRMLFTVKKTLSTEEKRLKELITDIELIFNNLGIKIVVLSLS